MELHKPTEKIRKISSIRKKSLKKPFLTSDAIDKMQNIPFDPLKFKRSASAFYNVTGNENSLYLRNKVKSTGLAIDFNHDKKHNYIKLVFSWWNFKNKEFQYLEYLTPKPRFNRDLFIKIFNRQIL